PAIQVLRAEAGNVGSWARAEGEGGGRGGGVDGGAASFPIQGAMAIDVDEPPLDLVRVTVQADWNDVVRDVAAGRAPRDRFWVSCYRKGCTSVHSGVLVGPPAPPAARETREPQQQQTAAAALTAESDLGAEWVDSASFALACPVLGADGVLVRAPRSSFSKPVAGPANSLDVSPQGQLLVVGGDEGQLRLLDAKDGRVRVRILHRKLGRLRAEFWAILRGEGTLEVGGPKVARPLGERSVGIHLPPFPASVTGTYFRSAVSDTAIVDKGRNILSCNAPDFAVVGQVVPVSYSLLRALEKPSVRFDPSDRPEIRFAAEVVCGGEQTPSCVSARFCYSENEELTNAAPLGSSNVRKIFSFQLGSPVTSCAVSPSGVQAAAATSDGVVIVVGVGAHPMIVAKFRRGGTAVNDMVFAEDDRLLLASADGCCTTVRIAGEDGVKVLEEFTGPDVDALYAVCVGAGTTGNRKFVWNAGRDNFIRRY
ncbi:MAG: hypothetical protein BJ554DRAFT_5473, partial [Olpidium bornovanus]